MTVGPKEQDQSKKLEYQMCVDLAVVSRLFRDLVVAQQKPVGENEDKVRRLVNALPIK